MFMQNNCNTQTAECSGVYTPKGEFPKETPLAMAYVPYQSWEETYPENKALEQGTIFPSLDLPFKGRQICQ